jgi:hypothetical protein
LKSQEEVLESLEKDLGLPRGFCFRLGHEDDWSFVVKLHALIESAASDFITRALGRKELADIFSRIEISKPQTGKVAFIRALNLLPVGHTKFIERLSRIRNQLAHKIGNAGFSFAQYFQHERQRLSEKEFAALGDLWAFGFVIAGQDYQHRTLSPSRDANSSKIRNTRRTQTSKDTCAFSSTKTRDSVVRSSNFRGYVSLQFIWAADVDLLDEV